MDATGRSSRGGDLRLRLLRHHLPLALASAVVLVLFMGVPRFDADRYPRADLFSAAFPKQRESRPAGHGRDRTGQHGGGQHGRAQTGQHGASQHDDSFLGLGGRRFTVATGYLATGLLALTLLIGPANLLLRRRNPVSSYLRRDVGTWTALFGVVHVVYGLEPQDGRILDNAFFDFFVGDGWPTTSFGLGNWTGLAALVILAGLLALSSDAALRKLKARTWKRL